MLTGRFAPSPTGQLHLGNLRTAMAAWLFARADNGRFLIRVEDLDANRRRPDLETQQISDLAALGLDWDLPIVRQSERRALHQLAIQKLQHAGLLYRCYCTRREIAESTTAPHGPGGVPYPGTCRELSAVASARKISEGRPAALRARASGSMNFTDFYHGKVTGLVDDFVVQRNDGAPAYNLAVVVDDADQGITQVVRGDDLLPTTHRQVWLAEMLSLPIPQYIHLPLVLGPSGERLAKRDGATSLSERIDRGESADHIRTWLASSLGIPEAAESESMWDLLTRFDASQMPSHPWQLMATDL